MTPPNQQIRGKVEQEMLTANSIKDAEMGNHTVRPGKLKSGNQSA